MGHLNREYRGSYKTDIRILPGYHDIDILGVYITYPDQDHTSIIYLSPNLLAPAKSNAPPDQSVGSSSYSGRQAEHVEMLSLITSSQEGSSFIGEERYSVLVKNRNRQTANRWLWWEVIHSLFSLA